MDEEEFKRLIDRSIIYRGRILHEISILELGINDYITRYFCDGDLKKSIDMHLLFLGDERVSLSNSAQIFHFLAAKYDKQWFDDYKSTRVPKKEQKKITLNNDIVYVIEERNVFAHRVIDISLIGSDVKIPKDTVRLLRFKNEITPLDYDKDKIKEIIGVIKNVKKYLSAKI